MARTSKSTSKRQKHLGRWIAGGIVVLLCAVLLLSLFSHGNGADPQDYAHRLTVLTYNTHRMGEFRKPPQNRVLQYLLRQDADIICLQEVEVYRDATYLTLGELRGTLREKYPYSYIDFSVYNSRRQFGNVVFSRYPLINKQTIRYPSRANISSRCDVVVGADTLRLITNHLESNRFDRGDFAEHIANGDSLKQSAHRLSDKWGKHAVCAMSRRAACMRR